MSARQGLTGRRRAWSLLATAAVLAAAWLLLAPPQLGGSTSYVIASGVSMLPRFHAGDVVVLRRQASYHPGEVAAYHNQQLGVVVMHRIIASRGGRYVFRGDNNDFTDSYQPTRAQIVGAEWVRLPGAGRYLLTLHQPLVAGAALALLWVFSFSPQASSRRQRRRHRRAG